MPQRRSAPVSDGRTIRRLLVRCSRTAMLIDSGETVEEGKFATLRLTNQKITCVHCGEVHRWSKKDVVLAR